MTARPLINVLAELIDADLEYDAAKIYWRKNKQVKAASSRLDRAAQRRAATLAAVRTAVDAYTTTTYFDDWIR